MPGIDPIAPGINDGLDRDLASAPRPKSVIGEVGEILMGTARHSKRAFEAAQKPGMPLSVLSNVVREAPLGSLLIAFVLGVAMGRRRAR